MAKRSLKGDASFGSSSKRFKSSSVTSEPHKTQSLLTQLNLTHVDASLQEPTHSTIDSGSLHRQGSSGSVKHKVEKRHDQTQQQPIQNDHASNEDLAVVTIFDLPRLPTKVLEMILCQVNIRDLHFSCRLVCKRWNNIVMREKFIPWKKTYYRHKRGGDYLHSIGEGWSGHTCLLDMAKFVCKTFEHFTFDVWICAQLQKHPRYNCVTRITECHPKSKQWCDHSIPAMVTLLVMCSRNMTEVHYIIKVLLSTPGGLLPPSFSLMEVLELFYCLATLCFVLWHDLNILPPRFHYLLFYCLNCLERGSRNIDCSHLLAQQRSSAGGLEQQSLFKYCSGVSSLKLTSEQLRIVNHRLQPGDIVKVVAFAGTGKTTTLQNFARLNPHIIFLYCAFNKSVQEHATVAFKGLKNVECRTFHSLAYCVGRQYRHKFSWGMKTLDVSRWVEPPERWPREMNERGEAKKENLFLFSKCVLQTVESFLASEDEERDMDLHVPMCSSPEVWSPVEKYQQAVISEARKVWDRMKNKDDRIVGMTHDGYLKLYQLQKPTLNYGCLLVDESQDLTPAIISILLNQRCPKVMVGDPHQQIYSFKGACNAFSSVQATRTYSLSESFRFGPEIAYVASCLLDVLKKVRRSTIVGNLQPGGVEGVWEGQLAVIARTNAVLFNSMVHHCNQQDTYKFGFAGGIQGYEFDMYQAIYDLMVGKKPQHNFISKFSSYDDLCRYAQRADDPALSGKLTVCERYNHSLPHYLEKIRGMSCSDIRIADVVFSTAHKSKGLEFDTVRLCDDFLTFLNNEDLDDTLPLDKMSEQDELNLLYVAVTRAKKQLIMSPTLVGLLRRAKECYLYPTGVPPVRAVVISCVRCKSPGFTGNLPIERSSPITLCDASVMDSGLVCDRCIHDCYGDIFSLPDAHRNYSCNLL